MPEPQLLDKAVLPVRTTSTKTETEFTTYMRSIRVLTSNNHISKAITSKNSIYTHRSILTMGEISTPWKLTRFGNAIQRVRIALVRASTNVYPVMMDFILAISSMGMMIELLCYVNPVITAARRAI